MPNLSDDRLVEYLEVQRDIFIHLEDRAPEFCRPIYFSEPLPSRHLPVDPALARRQQAIFAEAFRAEPNAGASLEGEPYEAVLGEVMSEVEAAVGENFVLLARETPVQGRDAEFCRTAAEMFNQLARSPQAGPLYRAMLLRAG
jgi:hypothetical protein